MLSIWKNDEVLQMKQKTKLIFVRRNSDEDVGRPFKEETAHYEAMLKEHFELEYTELNAN